MKDTSKIAAANAIAIFRQLTGADGRVDHKALLDEMEARNGGKPLTNKMQRTLAKMVSLYEART